jgi:hypothetical protein
MPSLRFLFTKSGTWVQQEPLLPAPQAPWPQPVRLLATVGAFLAKPKRPVASPPMATGLKPPHRLRKRGLLLSTPLSP